MTTTLRAEMASKAEMASRVIVVVVPAAGAAVVVMAVRRGSEREMEVGLAGTPLSVQILIRRRFHRRDL